jgi:hypothetical protein
LAQLAARSNQFQQQSATQARPTATEPTAEITPGDLLIKLRAHAFNVTKTLTPRLKRFSYMVHNYEQLNSARLLPTIGFCWRSLLAAFYDKPLNIFVVGLRDRTLERFEHERVDTTTQLRTSLENYLMQDGKYQTKPNECYAVNCTSPLPFICNIVQANSTNEGPSAQETLRG